VDEKALPTKHAHLIMSREIQIRTQLASLRLLDLCREVYERCRMAQCHHFLFCRTCDL